ncbi:MAG: hypothetical protein ACREPB_14990 [Arenimonas sp.]
MSIRLLLMASVVLIAACAKPTSTKPIIASDVFFNKLSAYCGKAFAGKLVAFNESDAKSFAGVAVMHVRSCSENEIRIPFHVGEDRSRTWVITKTGTGLRLKHDHRHQDGSEDKLTQYGGDTVLPGSTTRQEFPADAFSKALFERDGMKVSMENTWAVEVTDNTIFAYELRRPSRHFRVEFDLSKPVAIPPAAWGFENK